MVINSQDQITEAVAYQAYGEMVALDSIANAPEIPAREKFTGKEFDTEGEDSANGVVGIQCYYFGARYLDPEIGYWLSPDKLEQFNTFYAYAGNGANPIVMIDEDGNAIFTALTLAIIGVSAAVTSVSTAVTVANAGGSAGQIFLGALVGFGAGAVGGVAGAGVGSAVTGAFSAAFTSSLMGELVATTAGGIAGSAIGSATTNFFTGTGTGLLTGQSFGQSIKQGAISAGNGAVRGAIVGGITAPIGYFAGKGIAALRSARAANRANAVSKVAKDIRPDFADKMTGKGAEEIINMDKTVDGLVPKPKIPDVINLNPSQPNVPTAGDLVPLPYTDVGPAMPTLPTQGQVIVPGYGTNLNTLHYQNFDTGRNIIIFSFEPITF
jgi:RHS repeat-associated protein